MIEASPASVTTTMDPSGQIPLRAGPIQLRYGAGSLRYLRSSGGEVLRRIYVAVRDSKWDTVPAQITHQSIQQGSDCFRIDFGARHERGEIRFEWSGRVEGLADGTIRFAMSGRALSSFWKNRIGICVLHPIPEYAGRPCRIVHTTGAEEPSSFPLLVSPHQPFLDIRAVHADLASGLQPKVEFSGDVFETEDQRNWTDHSFKTYPTPLRLPFPTLIAEGERIEQSVTLRVGNATPRSLDSPPLTFAIGDKQARSFPALRKRVDLHLDSRRLAGEIEQSLAVGPADYAIFTDRTPAQWMRLADALRWSRPAVERWLVFDAEGSGTTAEAVGAARNVLGPLYPGVPFGGGADRNFAELNRNRDLIPYLDFVNWGISPQAHAIDDETLFENLSGQRSTVETARSFSGALPLSVSVMLRRYGAAADPRESSGLGAAWVLGSLKNLAESGIDSITYQHLSSATAILEDISRFAPESIQLSQSSDPLAMDGLVLASGGRRRLWLANFQPQDQQVAVAGARPMRVHLQPYAIETIELES